MFLKENKYKVVVFGDLPIATKIVMYLKSNHEIDLLGVIIGNDSPHCNDPWTGVPGLHEYCINHDVRVYTMEQLENTYSNQEIDLGLSCRFSKIIKPSIISLFKLGIINMHGGLLPEFAGLYSCNFSILFGSKKGGGTLHYIDEGIDTGNILRRCEFDILDEDTGFTVFQKTQIALYENMVEIIPLVLHGEIDSYPIQKLLDLGYEHRYFNKTSIHQYKEVNFTKMSEKEIINTIRAFDFPNYEPAYVVLDNKKINLRMN